MVNIPYCYDGIKNEETSSKLKVLKLYIKSQISMVYTAVQRKVLDEAYSLAHKGSLIPADKSYIQQRNTYDGAVPKGRFKQDARLATCLCSVKI